VDQVLQDQAQDQEDDPDLKEDLQVLHDLGQVEGVSEGYPPWVAPWWDYVVHSAYGAVAVAWVRLVHSVPLN